MSIIVTITLVMIEIASAEIPLIQWHHRRVHIRGAVVLPSSRCLEAGMSESLQKFHARQSVHSLARPEKVVGAYEAKECRIQTK